MSTFHLLCVGQLLSLPAHLHDVVLPAHVIINVTAIFHLVAALVHKMCLSIRLNLGHSAHELVSADLLSLLGLQLLLLVNLLQVVDLIIIIDCDCGVLHLYPLYKLCCQKCLLELRVL
jgi:hypothetical protein